jgi:hypothetical protein
MKLMAACALICLSLICLSLISSHASTPIPVKTCSCSANDGSCQASVTCSGGCLAFCPSGGCRAECTSNGGEDSPEIPVSYVGLHFNGSDSQAVSAELTRLAGQDVVFTPSTADGKVTLDADNLPFWDALEILSRSGRIQIGQDDFSNLRTVRRALLYGERISVCMHGVTVKRLVKELRYLTGLNIHVMSGEGKTEVNLTAREVNFNDIVTQVSGPPTGRDCDTPQGVS